MGCVLSCLREYDESPPSVPSSRIQLACCYSCFDSSLGDEDSYYNFSKPLRNMLRDSPLSPVKDFEDFTQIDECPALVETYDSSTNIDATGTASASNKITSYDVFLSFRGEDTRCSFTSHLYSSLRDRGINTFIDGKLRQGEELGPALLGAVEGSRMAIVIFSENYANSSWCLDELVKILECKEMKVLPVFYRVDPSDVRKPSGLFAEALARHEDRMQNSEKVKAWKEALRKAANLKGWHLTTHDYEAEFIQEIVKQVVSKVDSELLYIPSDLVGMESHIKVMSSLLDVEADDDVRMIGICGMGGIGKTTIAKTIYNRFKLRFELSEFLAGVRETCEKDPVGGLIKLQETLLSKLSWGGELKLTNVDRGINVIKGGLCNRKVLLIIDDVNHLKQLETLAGSSDWFGRGSRIIITTRDEHLLVSHGVKKVYNVETLEDHDALRLFSMVTFQKSVPEEDYYELSKEVLHYASGLPLAVKVLGSFLRGTSVSEWRSALEKLKKIPNREIFKVLEISFESLDDYEKDIFLDIACFFKGQPVSYVRKVLESCGFHHEIGIRVLVDKSLITTKLGVVQMHDMIEEMGKEIVRRGSPVDPSERTRLWFHEDVLDVLTENTGTSKIQGIKLDLSTAEDVCFNDDAFMEMKRLRLFIARNAVPSGGDSICFPNGLRWLDWPEYTLPSLPFGAGRKKLVGLNMSKSSIRELGDELKLFRMLRFADFSHSTFLSKLPDLSSLQNLESLELSECESLIEVHDSLGFLQKLIHLNFLNCRNLCSFPSSLRSKPLQSLILKGCSKISIFPEILVEVEGMTELFLDDSAIGELPDSIGNFTGLKGFYLKNCKKLKSLPSSIYKVQGLEYLDLSGCSQFEKFPDLGEGSSAHTAILPLSAFPNLIYFDLQGCNLSEVNFLEDLQCVSTLSILNLSENKFVRLPKGINRFTKLQQLNLTNCRQIQAIPELPPNISYLFAEGCESLESYASLSNMLQAPPNQSSLLKRIELHGCDKMNKQSDTNIDKMLPIEELLGNARVDIFHSGSEVPTWFLYRSTKERPRNHSTEGPESQVLKWFYLHSTERLVRFEVPSNIYPMVTGLAFCGVATSGKTTKISFEIQLFVNKERTYGFVEHFPLLKLDHLWFSYIPRKLMWELDTKLTHECSRFAVLFKVSGAVLGSCGVHLVQAPHLYEESEQDSPNLKKRRRHL